MKNFQLTVILTVDDDVDESDIRLYEDDVIDGFNITRSDRLGDITWNFHLTDAELTEVKQIS